MRPLPQRITAIVVAAAALAAAGPTAAAERSARPRVAVVVVPPFPLARYAGEGAVGLLVPGAGTSVTRAGALAALVRGRVTNSLLGGKPGGKPLIALARTPGDVTIYVALPPPGRSHNVRRYPVAVVGGGYRGVLTSTATRVPGLVSVADVAPTAVALGEGRTPRIRSRAAGDAVGQLGDLDRRLTAVHDVRARARVTLVVLLLVLFAGGLVLRSVTAARAGLLLPPAALAAMLGLSALGEAGPAAVSGTLVVAAAASLVVALLGDRVAAWAVAALACLLLVVLAVWPEVNALAAIGPHPDGGSRYYGVTNETETLLLAPTLAAVAVLGPAAALPAFPLVGWSRAGADGGGLLVYAAALAAWWLRARRRRVTLRLVAAVAAAVVGVAFALIGLDAATGGSSHVTTAVGSGPGSLVGDALHRWNVSWTGATQTTIIVVMTVSGLAALVVLAFARPRAATVDALLVGVAVSLVVNDTPQDVLAFGALGGALLWTWERLRAYRRPPS